MRGMVVLNLHCDEIEVFLLQEIRVQFHFTIMLSITVRRGCWSSDESRSGREILRDNFVRPSTPSITSSQNSSLTLSGLGKSASRVQ
jgi:hypothetical protein